MLPGSGIFQLRDPRPAIQRRRYSGDRSRIESTYRSFGRCRRRPIYLRHQTAKTRAADAGLILRARRYPLRRLMRESGAFQHAIERFLNGDRIHPGTRAKLARAVEKLSQPANKNT